jgi:hypothetical protein
MCHQLVPDSRGLLGEHLAQPFIQQMVEKLPYFQVGVGPDQLSAKANFYPPFLTPLKVDITPAGQGEGSFKDTQ